MNFEVHAKNFSQLELPNHSGTDLNKGTTSLLQQVHLGITKTDSPHTTPQKTTTTSFYHNQTHLQPFRNRVLRVQKKYQEDLTPQNIKEDSKDLTAIRVDKLCEETNNRNSKGFFNIPYAIKIQKDKKDIQVVHNFIYSAKHR